MNVTCNIFINSFGSIAETTMVSQIPFFTIMNKKINNHSWLLSRCNLLSVLLLMAENCKKKRKKKAHLIILILEFKYKYIYEHLMQPTLLSMHSKCGLNKANIVLGVAYSLIFINMAMQIYSKYIHFTLEELNYF